jgi:hypothetical protein
LEAHPDVVGDILGFLERSQQEIVESDVTIATRHICIATLLALLVSHVGIAVHAATHVSGDSGECEYCTAYGDSTHAVDAEHEQSLPQRARGHVSAVPSAPTASRQALPFRPRDPPLAN